MEKIGKEGCMTTIEIDLADVTEVYIRCPDCGIADMTDELKRIKKHMDDEYQGGGKLVIVREGE